MLALDVVPALRRAGWVVTALGRSDLDVTDAAQCVAAVDGHNLVVNAAAYTAVDVARACTRAGARLVHVSTDYVFDGEATRPYAVDHPVAPRSAYGRTKAAGEWAVRALCTESWVLRTAWLYGAGGPSFVSTMLRLAGERDTLSVVDDQVGQPTWTVDLADLAVRLVSGGAPFGVHHGTSSGQTTWFGLARRVFELNGLDPQRVLPTTTEAFPRPAPRPAWSVLSHRSLEQAGIVPIGDWSARIAEFLGQPVSFARS